MPTVFSHSIAALAVGKAVAPPGMPTKFWVASAVCAALPDIDVVSFAFGVRYDEMFGHRGITHSFTFALLLGVFVVLLFFRDISLFSGHWFLLAGYFFVITASHALLDALTNGGLGVALFAPFTNERYFFHWRPIQVSPIGVAFFSERGLRVLISELGWIWLPSGILVFLSIAIRRNSG
ncbi:MAG TPA: metal-dependent hydrolase [Pyrinomonadaceae bacterium]